MSDPLPEKVVICNIYKLVEEMWPKDQFIYSKDVAKKTVETAGVHISTESHKVLKEQKLNKRVSSPSPVTKRLTIVDKLDELELNGIRRKVHQFYFNNEPPTKEVLRVVNEDDSLPNFKRSTFQKVLK
ncbi:hypothetical protein ACJJTC_015353 [Scirpophaga incertulas]